MRQLKRGSVPQTLAFIAGRTAFRAQPNTCRVLPAANLGTLTFGVDQIRRAAIRRRDTRFAPLLPLSQASPSLSSLPRGISSLLRNPPGLGATGLPRAPG